MKTISKRWIKNAVAIVVMLALCGSMVFTMSYAKSHAQASEMPQMSQGSDSSGGPGSGGTPPDQSGSSDSNSQSGDQQNTQGSSGSEVTTQASMKTGGTIRLQIRDLKLEFPAGTDPDILIRICRELMRI